MVSIGLNSCRKSHPGTIYCQVAISIYSTNSSAESLGFELQIYRQLKLLNSLLTIQSSLQISIFKLLATLLASPQPDNREQPSILAHLGGDEKSHIPLIIELVTDPFTDPEI